MMSVISRDSFVENISKQISRDKYALIKARQFERVFEIDAVDLENFKACWGDLTRDLYMGDGGGYRFRRYGHLYKKSESRRLTLLPHGPYVQSSIINTLNGDVKRFFDPLTEDFLRSKTLKEVLWVLSDIYDSVENQARDWNIRLHPYRIYATSSESGCPTPEGLHRDGVTYVASLMINKCNVKGGITTVTNGERVFLEQVGLEKTFDIILADDAATMHEVSVVKPVNSEEEAYRDVLVIAFTREQDE